MDKKHLITEYFQKAAALVLSAAGVDSIEKQALYLIAAETERYANELGAHAAKFAEAARRSQCTVEDIDAAAKCLNDVMDISHYLPAAMNRIGLSSESKKRLRTSVENKIVHDSVCAAQVDAKHYAFPQFSDDHDPSTDSPLKTFQKRAQCYPEWLQKDLEAVVSQNRKDVRMDPKHAEQGSDSELAPQETNPLSMVSALVLAEEESRAILTNKLAGIPRIRN